MIAHAPVMKNCQVVIISSCFTQVITELMPLIVGVLEELDVAYQECDDAVQAIEELRDELAQTKQETKRQRQLREMVEEVDLHFIHIY